jgi:dTDP-4-dehydrorhamnose reductase
MKKVLIIGAKGNLGHALAQAYDEAQPTLWDREEIDITDERQCRELLTELKPDLVYNCAAYNAVDQAEAEAGVADNINGYAVGNLARVCAEIDAVLVHFSSNYVFDGKNPEGYAEDDKPNPLSAYGRSKRLGEIELAQNMEKYYLVRTAWLYGYRTAGKKSFIDIMLELAGQDGPVKCVTDEFGSPTYVKDLAQALVALTEQEKPFGIYHLTNSGMASWFDWAKEIFKIQNLDVKMLEIKSQDLKRASRRPEYGILNNTKFVELRPWSEALEEYLESDSFPAPLPGGEGGAARKETE